MDFLGINQPKTMTASENWSAPYLPVRPLFQASYHEGAGANTPFSHLPIGVPINIRRAF